MNRQQRALERLEAKIESLNKRYSIGEKVNLTMDDGEKRIVTINNEFTILGGHTPVGWFDEIRGCYLADRVSKIQ